MTVAKRLEQQNNMLMAQLSEKEGIVDKEKAQEQEALQVLYQLKETVDKQRDAIRAKDDEIATRTLEVEALQQHVDRLAKVTADLRRKNELLNTMAKNFIQEKSQLQSQLTAMDKQQQQQQQTLTEHQGIVEQQQKSTDDGGDALDGEANEENVPTGNMVTIDLTGKEIIDLSDPDRPRFTLLELQTVLQERDELKLDVMELEDELQQYRPKEVDVQLTEADQKRPRSNSKNKGEPSGIKKLFSFLFGGKNNVKPSPEPQDESTWEFLEKPKQELPPADEATLAVTGEDQRGHSVSLTPSLSPPARVDSPIPEETPLEDDQRRRSYSGPVLMATRKEPFKQRERMTCVRTDSHQLIELGHDIASLCRPDLNADPAVPATSAMSPPGQPISRNNSNSAGETKGSGGGQMMMEDRQAGDAETTGQESSTDVPKILINNNDIEEAEVEM
ncbi:RILP-like protein 1 isoform X2 [Acanthaster planci]|nr:RILP-like protein 1 isoform X2 [Acanthaster planci]